MHTISREQIQSFIQPLGLSVDAIADMDLLQQALTHKSYAADFSDDIAHNERLEFVGDAVLGSAIATLLWHHHEDKTEAEMTLYKIALVREETLALVAKNIGIGNIVLISKGEEKSDGRNKASILSDTLEAFIGYIAIDMGYATAYTFIQQWIYSHIDTLEAGDVTSNKTKLQEYIQKSHKTIPHYVDHIEDSANNNVLLYRSDVFVGSQLLASGYGTSKKKAQDEAASNALVGLKTGQEIGNN